jgi:hypothetical protein
MEFINEESYKNIVKYNKINNKINNALIEINNLQKKKKGNESILVMQETIFYNIIESKLNLIKKYKFTIIKNVINYYKNQLIIKVLNKLILKNKNNLLNNKINKIFFTDNINNKLHIEYNKIKLLNKYYINENYEKLDNLLNQCAKKILKDNPIKNDNIYILKQYLSNINFNKKDIKYISINFILYLFKYNNTIDLDNIDKYHNNIYKILLFIYYLSIYKIKIKLLHNELKDFFKQQKFNNKLNCNSEKLLKDIKKSYKKNDIIIKKSNQLIIKYKHTEKHIKNQFMKHNKIKEDFRKNITDIDLNIILLKEMLIIHNKKKELLEKIINKDNIKYSFCNDINDNCSICLNKLDYCIQTKCSHHFHYNCIISYIYNLLENSSKIDIICPICRQYI